MQRHGKHACLFWFRCRDPIVVLRISSSSPAHTSAAQKPQRGVTAPRSRCYRIVRTGACARVVYKQAAAAERSDAPRALGSLGCFRQTRTEAIVCVARQTLTNRRRLRRTHDDRASPRWRVVVSAFSGSNRDATTSHGD